MQIGKVTTSATKHQNFLANLIPAIEHQHFSPTLARRQRTKKARCTAANNTTINTYFVCQRLVPSQIQSGVCNSR